MRVMCRMCVSCVCSSSEWKRALAPKVNPLSSVSLVNRRWRENEGEKGCLFDEREERRREGIKKEEEKGGGGERVITFLCFGFRGRSRSPLIQWFQWTGRYRHWLLSNGSFSTSWRCILCVKERERERERESTVRSLQGWRVCSWCVHYESSLPSSREEASEGREIGLAYDNGYQSQVAKPVNEVISLCSF